MSQRVEHDMMTVQKYQLASRLFPALPLGQKVTDKFLKSSKSRSYKLLKNAGLLAETRSVDGLWAFSPLLQKSVDKLIRLVDEQMRNIGGQKLSLPMLSSRAVWEKSGRWSDMAESMFVVEKTRRGLELCLQPTCEEAVTEFVANFGAQMGQVRMPLLLYQIDRKFRNELKPRRGLLRSLEFLMKDMYSFDADEPHALATYETVTEAYRVIFETLGLPVMRVSADSGLMGRGISHEFHIEQDGEDLIFYCKRCSAGVSSDYMNANSALYEIENKTEGAAPLCTVCKSPLTSHVTAELAHTFVLGQQYTRVFDLFCGNSNDDAVYQCCFGIGLSRLLDSALHHHSTDENIGWPAAVAPYKVALIPPKQGSLEEKKAGKFVWDTVDFLSHLKCLEFELLVDDRRISVGRRLQSLSAVGIPVVVVAAKTAAADSRFELYETTKAGRQTHLDLSHAELISRLRCL